MQLYADEDFALPIVEFLRQMGHDAITAQEDGHASASDSVILARADALNRIVLTFNRRHFERLHRNGASHHGIVLATRDPDYGALAQRIHDALQTMTSSQLCIRVNRPAKP